MAGPLPSLDLTEFGGAPPPLDLAEFSAPPKPNGALNEIGTGALRGALLGVPTLAGQALQYTSSPGNWAYQTGKGLVDSATARGQQPYLQMHPEAHNAVTNAIAGGAEQVAPMLGAAGLAAGAIAAAPFELPAAAAAGLTAAGMAAPFAMQAGQATLDKAQAKGVAHDDAQTAARLSAASNFAVQTGLGLVGGQMLGKFSTSLGSMVGKEAAPLAEQTMAQLTGQNGAVAPLLKQLPTSAAEAVGLGAAQSGVQAGIENKYGIDDTSPLTAMKDSVVPMLGLTAAMAPLGLAGRALAIRAAKQHTDVLANPETDPTLRGQVADQYAAAIGRVNPDAAATFRANADVAIKNKMPLSVDPGLFAAGHIEAPVAEEPPAAPLGIGNTPTPMAVFPDGTVSANPGDADRYINSLPEDQRVAARAKLYGLGEQPITPVAETPAVEAPAVEAPIEPVPEAAKTDATIPPEAAPALRVPPSAEPVSDRTNTQVADALADAQRAKAAEDAKTGTDQAFAARDAQDAAAKERDLTAIQNITAGKDLADAAANGTVPDTAKLLPVSHNDFLDALKEVTPEDQALPPKLKQELVQAVRGKATNDDQIAAVKALQESKKTSTVGYELLGKLHDKLTEGRELPDETPATEAAPTEAIQAKAQGPEPTPAVAEAPQDARANAHAAADRLDTTLAGFYDRLRGGEKLSPEEQARFSEAGDLRKTLADSISSNKSDDYLNDIAKFADDTATPEAYAAGAKDRLSRLPPANPEVRSPALAAAITQSPSVDSALAHMADKGSAPWVRDLATKLQGMGLKTTIDNGQLGEGFREGAVGGYDANKDHITIPAGNETEATTLHEVVHAATFDAIERAKSLYGPTRSQGEAQLRAGYASLEKVRAEALKKASEDDQYGLTDAHEFMAELNSNPDFRAFLSKKSLWTRTVEAVRNLLGLKTDTSSMLDKAMSAQDALFNKDQYDAAKQARDNVQKFNASPEGAAQVTDGTLAKIAATADAPSFWDKISLRGMDMAAFKVLAGAKTSQYIADRVRALPEMVQSGVSGGMDSLLKAQETMRMAGDRAGQAPAKFSHDVGTLLRGMKDDDARELNKQMARFGTNGSIGGYDPQFNFDKNKEMNPALDPANKTFIDGEYRDFQRLKSTNPAAAAFVTEGAKVNRLGYVQTVASILRNTLAHPSNQNGDGAALAPLAGGLDFMAKDLAAERNGDAAKHLNGASYALDQRINAVFNAAKQLDINSPLRAQMAALELPYKNLMANPYYSAGREGNYFVNVGFKDMDAATWAKMEKALVGTNKVLGNFQDQDHAFFRVDTSDQMAGLERKLLAAGGDKIDVGKNSRGLLSQNGNLADRAGIPSALRTVLANLQDTVDTTPGLNPAQGSLMKDAMTRQILSLLPETSSKLATIKRMGVPGYDGDFLGNFTKRASGATHDLSHVYTAQDFANAFKQMNDGVDTLARANSAEMQEKARVAVDELNLRHQNSLTPLDNSPVNTINSFGHTFYLAVAPAFYIRTMAQPWHRGMPYMGSRFGWVDTAKELAAATPTALKIMKASIAKGWGDGGLVGVANADMNFKNMGLSPTEEAFVQELHDRGKLKLGMAQELQRLTLNTGSQKMQDAVKVAGLTAQYAEMTNRLITGLSAFRLAQAGKGGKNLGFDGNTEYAMNAIDRVMDNFDSTNTARAIGKYGVLGKGTPLATQFMNYQLQTMQQLARTAHDGFFNRDQSPAGQQRSAEAKKEFAGLFATTAMISGAMGMPFVNAAAGVYNMLTSDEDNPTDIRESSRNWLANTFGAGVGDVIAHGAGHLPALWGSTAGVDTSTFGLQNLLPGSEFLVSRRLMKDRLADQSEALMGPALNGVADIVKAGSQLAEGNYVKGVENALPSGLKGYYKSAELAGVFGPGGYTNSKGIQTGVQASGWDTALQATGLRPAVAANTSEATQYEIEDNELRAHRAQLIKDKFIRAQGDPEALAEASSDVAAFNAKNPIQPLTGQALALAARQHAMSMATAQSSGTGVGATNKRQAAVNSQRLQFGNIGGALDSMPRY